MKKITVLVGLLVWQTSLQAQSSNITIDLNEGLRQLEVRHCFVRAPAALQVQYTLRRHIRFITWEDHDDTRNLAVSGNSLRLPEGHSGCLAYVVDHVERNVRGHQKAINKQHPETRILDIDRLLLRTIEVPGQMPIIEIRHPSAVKLSAPWQLLQRSALNTRYRMKPTPTYSRGFLAIGKLSLRTVYLGSSRLRLAVMSTNPMAPERLEQWVRTMAGTVALTGGSFPLPDIQVLIIDMPGSSEPVPWGQVNRAGGQGVLFVVNTEFGDDQLYADWTAAHEFSHLLTPYTPNDRWLSEGFASYHQNITRLRSGLLDERTAWKKLLAGFRRGQKAAEKTDASVLKHAGRRHSMQMYWGGAVIALKAEVALQQATGGRMNLTLALRGLQECCLNTGQSWSAAAMFTELDRISGTQVFSTLYEEEVKRQRFPEFTSLLEQLGVVQTRWGSLRFEEQAPLAHIRKRIASG
ncbi:hypothetical protein ACFODZ_02725 [Marinicella sediminis]|uniref:Peptidase M61 catalytic domain-containing protein n=1 Tax=Marinicella sediminis TaxID=1792834 RepID=A0ABV7JA88_9GAMM|nr:hypothetical protein [Marinicella sediminis]